MLDRRCGEPRSAETYVYASKHAACFAIPLVGTAGDFRDLSPGDPALFSDSPVPRSDEIFKLEVEL
jgi:hypothetical protein